MSKKIVITGGLGYIGTELCKIYSGISWNNEILVIDNRFISERVNQLRNWGINFIHGDTLDKDLIKKHLSDSDIVHHLAGITNVPRISKESNESINNKIDQVAKKILNRGYFCNSLRMQKFPIRKQIRDAINITSHPDESTSSATEDAVSACIEEMQVIILDFKFSKRPMLRVLTSRMTNRIY